MHRDHPQSKQVNIVLLRKQVDWLDKQARLLRLDRSKVTRMIIDGLMRTESATKQDDSLFNLYSNHLEAILAEAHKKKKAKRK